MDKQPAICSVDGCDKKARARSFCVNHYAKWQRNGTPDGNPRISNRSLSLAARLERRSERDPVTGCWLWQGTRHGGYGYIQYKGRRQLVHRASYKVHVGPIPNGLEIDHLCGVRRCLNPEHLEPVTHAENQRRKAETKTHCVHGHEYTGDNVGVTNGSRYCRACRREA
jgi:hypothetical protein